MLHKNSKTITTTEGFHLCQESEGSASQKQPTSKSSRPVTRYFPPFAAHAAMSIHHPQLQHPKGMLTSREIFPASRKTWCTVCRAPNVHQQCTLGRLDAGWRNALESTTEMSSTEGMTFLYLPTSAKPIIHWRAGLANQEYCKQQEMRLIFKYGTVGSSGLNQGFSFT